MGLSFCPVYAFVVDDWLTIVLAVGLGVRIMRLITLDAITQPIRDRLSGFLGALIECPWCTGVWIAVPVGLSWWAWSDQTWWQVICIIATVAWACGALAGAGMPSQHEISTVSPVALINADDPVVDTIEVKDTVEVKVNSELNLTDAEIEEAVARVLKRRESGEAAQAPDGEAS